MGRAPRPVAGDGVEAALCGQRESNHKRCGKGGLARRTSTRVTDRNTAAESSAVSASEPSKKPKSGLRAALGTLLLQASGRLHGRLRGRAQSAAWLLHYVAVPHSAQNGCAVLGRASARVL